VTSEISTGTSTSGPITVANATGEASPNAAMASVSGEDPQRQEAVEDVEAFLRMGHGGHSVAPFAVGSAPTPALPRKRGREMCRFDSRAGLSIVPASGGGR
jgi:hypothetical protein